MVPAHRPAGAALRLALGSAILALVTVLASACATPDIPVAPSRTPAPTSTPGNGSRLVIGASFPVLDPFLATVADALRTHAGASNVDAQVVSAEGSGDTQLEQIQAFVDQKVDAIIVVPDHTDATAPITDLVRAARIPLVYLNRRPSDLPTDGSIPFVGTDSLDAGTMEMTALADRATDRGNVALLIGDPSNEAAVVRTEGAKDVIVEHPELRLVREAAAGWDRKQAHDIVQAWLAAGERIDIVCANDDEMALGAIDALREAELLDRTLVGGVDGTPDALAAIGSGDLDLTVFQDATAQGSGALDAAVSLVRGQTVTTDEGVIAVPQTLVTRDNVGNYLAHG